MDGRMDDKKKMKNAVAERDVYITSNNRD